MSYCVFILVKLKTKTAGKPMSYSIMQNLLFKLTAYCRCRIIKGNDGQPYLERYHLLSLPFGSHLYCHRFVAGDPGKGLHNHPWKAAISLILSGQYIETRLDRKKVGLPFKKRLIGSGSLNFINGDIYHRIDVSPNNHVWSLFIHTKKQASWGFIEQSNTQLAYQDHDNLVENHNNPQWWQQADKPILNPLMRQPLI